MDAPQPLDLPLPELDGENRVDPGKLAHNVTTLTDYLEIEVMTK